MHSFVFIMRICVYLPLNIDVPILICIFFKRIEQGSFLWQSISIIKWLTIWPYPSLFKSYCSLVCLPFSSLYNTMRIFQSVQSDFLLNLKSYCFFPAADKLSKQIKNLKPDCFWFLLWLKVEHIANLCKTVLYEIKRNQVGQ